MYSQFVSLLDLAIAWDEITEEATELLRQYLRINTTNPPGGEEAGALFLRDVLAREGVDSELFDAGSSRVSMAARLAASSSGGGKPIVLLSHIDVVPVEVEHWEEDPFGGALVKDTIWGRGALDMKGMGIMELMVLALLKRHRVELNRDILFVAVADEEEGGIHGVHHLMREAPHLFDAEFVFNEGAYGICDFMGRETRIFGLGPSEKSPCWIKLRVQGAPGHASIPHQNNAVAKLIQALSRVESHVGEARLTAPVEGMLRTLASKGLFPEDLDPNDPETLEALGAANNHLHAVTHDTASLTGFHAGQKMNVIPVTAEATVDCRLLPGTDHAGFVADLQEVMDDPDVKVEVVYQHESGETAMGTEVEKVASAVIREKMGEDAFVMPMLCPGFTDSHAFRKFGANAYGFTPALLTSEELATIHGHNERISVGNLGMATEILFDVIARLAIRN